MTRLPKAVLQLNGAKFVSFILIIDHLKSNSIPKSVVVRDVYSAFYPVNLVYGEGFLIPITDLNLSNKLMAER